VTYFQQLAFSSRYGQPVEIGGTEWNSGERNSYNFIYISVYFLRFFGDARREPALAGRVRDAGDDGRGGEARNRSGE
jgi:hypothetical protein